METKYIYIGEDTHTVVKLMRHEAFKDMELNGHPYSALNYLKANPNVEFVIFEAPENTLQAQGLIRFFKDNMQAKIPFVVIARSKEQQKLLSTSGADDVFAHDFNVLMLHKRILFLLQNKGKMLSIKKESIKTYTIPVWKRAFDILFSSVTILLLLPLLTIIAIAIRIESKGKVIYGSKRVGTGYKIFYFYKFRSMYTGADKKLSQLMKQNQYARTENETVAEDIETIEDQTMLWQDDRSVPEHEYLKEKNERQETPFFKVANDPRITKVGRIIRNTSLDELPQLFNVLKGDMSIVGNRPLPMYESELLTTDEWIHRFSAPSGLTGIWQIKKRGGANKMSASDRKQLDIEYANNYTFWGDLMIMFKTLPAMLQHENV